MRMHKPLKILICGTGWSGSGAVIDLLREYKNISIIPGEFDDFRRPGLVSDMLYNFNTDLYLKQNNNLINASYRLKKMRKVLNKKNFFNSLSFITKLKPKYNLFQLLYLLRNYYYEKKLLLKLSSDLHKSNSLIKTVFFVSSWINKIADFYGKKAVVFDQIFDLDDLKFLPFVDDVFQSYKIIFVYRDLNHQISNIMKDVPWYLDYTVKRFNATTNNPFKFMCKTIKNREKNMHYIQKKFTTEKVLLIKFDDLIENYPQIKTKIEQFLGNITLNHFAPLSWFNPEVSRTNTLMLKNILTIEQIEYIQNLK